MNLLLYHKESKEFYSLRIERMIGDKKMREFNYINFKTIRNLLMHLITRKLYLHCNLTTEITRAISL